MALIIFLYHHSHRVTIRLLSSYVSYGTEEIVGSFRQILLFFGMRIGV